MAGMLQLLKPQLSKEQGCNIIRPQARRITVNTSFLYSDDEGSTPSGPTNPLFILSEGQVIYPSMPTDSWFKS